MANRKIILKHYLHFNNIPNKKTYSYIEFKFKSLI